MKPRIRRRSWCLGGVLGLLVVGLPAAPQQPVAAEVSKGGRIEGRVLSLSDGKALAGASVRLRRYGETLSAPDPNEAAYTTQTGPGGTYVLDGVDPGSYRLYVDQPGYVRQFYGSRSSTTPTPGTVLQLARSQTLTGLDVKLAPQGSITGRVENQDREPVGDVNVSALRISYGGGHRLLIPMAFTDTSVDGGFTLRPLPPGQYYVRVDQNASPRVTGSSKEGQREALQKIVRRTFYPNAEGPEAAAALTVAAGAELAGINLRVKPGKMFSVRGKIDWGGVKPPDSPLVLALVTTAFDIQATIRPNLATVQGDGTFFFDEVVPGTYYLEPARVVVDTSKQRGIGGTLEVEVRDDDLSGIEFRTMALPALTGRIVIEGAPASGVDTSGIAPTPTGGRRQRVASNGPGVPPPPPPSQTAVPPPPGQTPLEPQLAQNGSPGSVGPKLQSSMADVGGTATIAPAAQPATADSPLGDIAIRLRAAGRLSVNAPQAASKTDGTFSLPPAPLGRYHVTITNLPEGTYVKSVLFSGRDITNSELNLMSGIGGEIGIVLAREAGEVTGTVRDAHDSLLPDTIVSIWRTDRGSSETCRTVTTDDSGTFRANHLAPGQYRAVAWAEIDPGLAGLGAFCRLFGSDGVSIGIDEHGNRQSIDLKAVPSARIEEAVWKLPR